MPKLNSSSASSLLPVKYNSCRKHGRKKRKSCCIPTPTTSSIIIVTSITRMNDLEDPFTTTFTASLPLISRPASALMPASSFSLAHQHVVRPPSSPQRRLSSSSSSTLSGKTAQSASHASTSTYHTTTGPTFLQTSPRTPTPSKHVSFPPSTPSNTHQSIPSTPSSPPSE